MSTYLEGSDALDAKDAPSVDPIDAMTQGHLVRDHQDTSNGVYGDDSHETPRRLPVSDSDYIFGTDVLGADPRAASVRKPAPSVQRTTVAPRMKAENVSTASKAAQAAMSQAAPSTKSAPSERSAATTERSAVPSTAEHAAALAMSVLAPDKSKAAAAAMAKTAATTAAAKAAAAKTAAPSKTLDTSPLKAASSSLAGAGALAALAKKKPRIAAKLKAESAKILTNGKSMQSEVTAVKGVVIGDSTIDMNNPGMQALNQRMQQMMQLKINAMNALAVGANLIVAAAVTENQILPMIDQLTTSGKTTLVAPGQAICTRIDTMIQTYDSRQLPVDPNLASTAAAIQTDAANWKSQVGASTGITAGTSAVAWAPSTNYMVGMQVTSNGMMYKCTTAGTSSASLGPSGSAASITDGSVVWAYVGVSTTATAAATGVSSPWTPSTYYAIGAQVSNVGNLYTCAVAGVSAATGGPFGQMAVVDGTVHWNFAGVDPMSQQSMASMASGGGGGGGDDSALDSGGDDGSDGSGDGSDDGSGDGSGGSDDPSQEFNDVNPADYGGTPDDGSQDAQTDDGSGDGSSSSDSTYDGTQYADSYDAANAEMDADVAASKDDSVQGDVAPELIVKSELPGVSDQNWTKFVLAMRTAPLGAVSKSNALGAFELKPKRLGDLDIVMGLESTRSESGRMVWIGEFIPPYSAAGFLKSPQQQYEAFARSMKDYAKKLKSGAIPKPDGGTPPNATLSGILAILHRAGPQGLKSWNTKKMAETSYLYTKTNGIF